MSPASGGSTLRDAAATRAPRRACAVLASLLLGVAAPHAGALDLVQAWRLARASDPVLAQADAARQAVHEDVVQARAPLLPQLSAGFALQQSRDPAFVPARVRSRLPSATLTQAIVDVARTAQVSGAKASAQAQDALVRAAEQALVVRVASAYFGVLGAQDALENTQANEAAYAQQVSQSEARYR